jgi:hypothetical protein
MAALVDRRRWRVAREALDARGSDAAGLVADDDGGVVGAAVLVRDRVARLDLVIVAAPLDARGHEQFTAQQVHRTLEVEVERGLLELERAGVGFARRFAVFVPVADVD